MKTRIKIKGLKIDTRGFTKTFNEALDTQLRQAARAWLKEVIIHVPIWLGTSRGSLIPLGQFLRVAIPITPNPKAHPRAGLGPTAGTAQGFFEFKHLEKGVTFTFRTEVFHFIQNELYPHDPEVFHLIEQTPWKSFRYGRQAFDKYLQENLKNKIPKIKDFVIREDIYIKG